jgi:hypothetical protein
MDPAIRIGSALSRVLNKVDFDQHFDWPITNGAAQPKPRRTASYTDAERSETNETTDETARAAVLALGGRERTTAASSSTLQLGNSFFAAGCPRSALSPRRRSDLELSAGSASFG